MWALSLSPLRDPFLPNPPHTHTHTILLQTTKSHISYDISKLVCIFRQTNYRAKKAFIKVSNVKSRPRPLLLLQVTWLSVSHSLYLQCRLTFWWQDADDVTFPVQNKKRPTFAHHFVFWQLFFLQHNFLEVFLTSIILAERFQSKPSCHTYLFL